ncbi:IS200/IS605 family element transposase accessory protein TnpB [Natronomonas halophila]|uniref:RNA-guided endonuclease InsQ/TnpB family protein n=1 Tax=Natronomonas halophila TaxID=2747817 RepID=UPI0015B6907F|nr:RNA-guided endonuclease TnpB family protein [Natronomonas halophila]QLD86221.1 IS200/IS605 family element transposase accessory protein TnpB [Natronomonas halophila]
MQEWQNACQIAAESAWGVTTDATSVQSMAYDAVRDGTSLKSQHAILATHRVADTLRSITEKHDRGWDAPKPRFTSPTVVYDERSMSFLDDGTVSLATTEGRVSATLRLPDKKDGYQQQYLDDEAWEHTQSTLHERDGAFFLHIGFKKPAEPSRQPEYGTVLGVDLGIDNIAVTSTAQFFSGSELEHRRRQFRRKRRRLKETGTRSALRTLIGIENKERRIAREILHRVSNGIVAEAERYCCDIIAFEALDGIRNRLPAGDVFHSWAFRRLIEYTTYKARSAGIRVTRVSPEYTSQRCAECGHVEEANRSSRDEFVCQSCNARSNADYNAAKNIGERAVRCVQQSTQRTSVSRYALKSGTVTPDEGFTPRDGGVRG